MKFFIATLLSLASFSQVSAHGFLSYPKSRMAICNKEITQADRDNYNCFRSEYDMHSYRSNFNGGNKFERLLAGEFNNGRICSGLMNLAEGRNYEPFNKMIASTNYLDATKEVELEADIRVYHGGSIHFLLSKDGVYGKTGPVTINDFEVIPNCVIHDVNQSKKYKVKCKLPSRNQGKQTILFAYDCSITTELFTGCADVMLLGTGGGSGGNEPEPPKPDPSVNPSTCPPHATTTLRTTVRTTLTSTKTVTQTQIITDPSCVAGDENETGEICDHLSCSEACAVSINQGISKIYTCLDGINYRDCINFTNDSSTTYAWC